MPADLTREEIEHFLAFRGDYLEVRQLHDEDSTSVAIGDLRRARALLQGGPDAG